MTASVSLRPGQYRDSVTLMQLSRDLGALAGVRTAFVAMATELNLELLVNMGLQPPAGVSPNDMVVAIEAADEDALAGAQRRLEQLLAARASTGTGATQRTAPRTVRSAARQAPDATLVVLSVPGPAVLAEASDALDAGLSVMIFSDNVPVEDEIVLKDQARQRGQLVMGPDCGTAMLGGVGLGFANVVRPGPVGLVAASGTGAQQLTCLLDAAGVGIRHCLGVGGRDLSTAVGGRSTLQALDLLAADKETELIVLVSKPPAPEVTARVTAHAERLGKPVLFALLGRGRPDLTAAAADVVRAAGGTWTEPQWWPAPQERRGPYASLRGLYSGGTLCDEAMVIASATLGPIASNIPLEPAWALPPDHRSPGHLMIDFGDDALTRGRPHPMIDPSLRLARLAEEATDPSCGVLLLDVVLGHAAHPDPAAELAPALRAARQRAGDDGRDLAVVITLIGTAADPQGLAQQAGALRAAGASVHRSNAAAARKAVELIGAPP